MNDRIRKATARVIGEIALREFPMRKTTPAGAVEEIRSMFQRVDIPPADRLVYACMIALSALADQEPEN